MSTRSKPPRAPCPLNLSPVVEPSAPLNLQIRLPHCHSRPPESGILQSPANLRTLITTQSAPPVNGLCLGERPNLSEHSFALKPVQLLIPTLPIESYKEPAWLERRILIVDSSQVALGVFFGHYLRHPIDCS